MTASNQKKHVDSAVIVPVYRDHHGEVHIVIVRRADGGPHGGQLAFPGGKRTAGDASLLDTALRETHEEIGLEPVAVQVLEQLEPVDTMVSGFLITPFLARIDPPPRWILEPSEIVEVIDMPLQHFADPEVHDSEMRRFDALPHPIRIGFYRVGKYELWGASYRIFHPLLPRLLDGEWEI
jgi:8-oxo-dGTP pyrophosphatase MutT (NUDIX family)